MMRQFLTEIFALPSKTLIKSKLTKKFFLKNFDLLTKEKKAINQDINEMQLFASITEESSNIIPFINDNETYENIFIISISINTKDADKSDFVSGIIQKYFPYHCLVFINDEDEFKVSAALKRINKSDMSKRVIEEEIITPKLSLLYKNDIQKSFYNQVHFMQVDKTNLKTLYKDYFTAIVNYKSSCFTNQIINRPKFRTNDDLNLLKKIDELNLELEHINYQINKSVQTNQEVMLNTKRYGVKQEIEKLKAQLTN